MAGTQVVAVTWWGWLLIGAAVGLVLGGAITVAIAAIGAVRGVAR